MTQSHVVCILCLPDKYPKDLAPRIQSATVLEDMASMEISDLSEVMEAEEVSSNTKMNVLMKGGGRIQANGEDMAVKWEGDIHKPEGEDQEEPILGCFGLPSPWTKRG